MTERRLTLRTLIDVAARSAATLAIVVMPSFAGGAEPKHTPPPNSGPGDGEAYVKLIRPLPGWHAAVAWMEAIQDTRRDEPGWVEVDWLRLHAVVDGKGRVIHEDDFGPDRAICGGLYMRTPWYGEGSAEGNTEEPMQQSAVGDAVRLVVSERPGKVWHWYGCERADVPDNATNVWAEARIRVHGSAVVGLGIDYWRDVDAAWAGFDVNNTEACGSEWSYDDDPSWRVISIAKPDELGGD